MGVLGCFSFAIFAKIVPAFSSNPIVWGQSLLTTSLDLHPLVRFINLVGIKNAYEALILLNVGELSPVEIKCSLPTLNLFPEMSNGKQDPAPDPNNFNKIFIW